MRYIPILLLLITLLAPAGEEHSPLQISIMFTNDIHGGIVPQKAEFLNPEFPPMLGGAPSAARLIKAVRRDAESSGNALLLIDGGDTFQGTLVGTRSKGMAVVQYMNMMGYDAVVPGNHDFDLGKDNLIEMIQASQFPWVAANIMDAESGDHWEWVKPWTVINKAGLKIGISGAITTGTEHMSFPQNILGLRFADEITSLQAAVDQLREKEVDLVVVLVHVGLPYDPREGYTEMLQKIKQAGPRPSERVNAMEIAHFVRGIDVLLGGHLHKGYTQPWEDPVNHTICVQNYANGGNLGWIDVEIDPATRSIAGYHSPAGDSDLLLLTQDQFWPDSAVAAFIQEQRRVHEKGFHDVIGQTPSSLTRSSLGESPLNNLICDVLRESAGADFAFMNFGGIRADIRPGPITREDVFKVLPFGNEVVSFQVSGAFIKRILERKVAGSGRGLAISGAQVVVNPSAPSGRRIVRMVIGGRPLQADQIYRVATNDYLLEGNSGLDMLRDIPRQDVDFSGMLLSDALINYLQAHQPLQSKTDGRWKRDDQAQAEAGWMQQFEAPEMVQ